MQRCRGQQHGQRQQSAGCEPGVERLPAARHRRGSGDRGDGDRSLLLQKDVCRCELPRPKCPWPCAFAATRLARHQFCGRHITALSPAALCAGMQRFKLEVASFGPKEAVSHLVARRSRVGKTPSQQKLQPPGPGSHRCCWGMHACMPSMHAHVLACTRCPHTREPTALTRHCYRRRARARAVTAGSPAFATTSRVLPGRPAAAAKAASAPAAAATRRLQSSTRMRCWTHSCLLAARMPPCRPGRRSSGNSRRACRSCHSLHSRGATSGRGPCQSWQPAAPSRRAATGGARTKAPAAPTLTELLCSAGLCTELVSNVLLAAWAWMAPRALPQRLSALGKGVYAAAASMAALVRSVACFVRACFGSRRSSRLSMGGEHPAHAAEA